ncbi:MAG: restriction endonuclease [Candidatus Nezhaarchaeales archaeon]
MALTSTEGYKVLLKLLEHKNIKIDELYPAEIEKYLLYLHDQNIVHLDREGIQVVDPISLAIETIKLGASIEAASRWLSWKEFERFCAEALMNHNFKVKAPFRFKANDKRYEVDVLAHRASIVLCIDCKHWKVKKGQWHKIKSAALSHLNKCINLRGLPDILRSLGIGSDKAHVFPVIVTLIDLDLKTPVSGVLILPIFKFNSFLLDLEKYVDELPSINTY